MKINKKSLKDGLVSSHRRYKQNSWNGAKVIATDGNNINDVIDIRCYYTDARVYTCIWVSIPYNNESIFPVEKVVSGSGWADGFGYNKQDAAIHSAIQSMGIEISRDWEPGSGKWKEWVETLARQIYPKACVKVIEIYP